MAKHSEEGDDRAAGATPVYRLIFDQLSDRIQRGELSAGMQLPSERQLAEQLQVSRMTARAAVNLLVQRGLVERRERSGVYVAPPKIEQLLSSTAGLSEQLLQRGLHPGARVVSCQTLRAGEVSPLARTALGLGVEDVHQVLRLRLGNGEPLALEESYFPARLCPDLFAHDLEGSVYDTLARVYGLRAARSRQVLEPTSLDLDAARLLGTHPDRPALRIARTTWDAQGRSFEYARDLYRADRIQFVVDSRTPEP